MKKVMIGICALLFCGSLTMRAADYGALSLDSCRALAIRENKELRMASANQRAAFYERKAALTKYLPRVSAMGAYLYTSKEFSLLSDEQKATLNGLGTTVGAMAPSLAGMTETLNGVGHGLVEALHTDTRNMGALGVMLTQPIYMGGKIAAYNRITRFAEQVAMRQHDLTLQEVIVEVDEAYWQIVSLQQKKRLAESYLALVRKLESDVDHLIQEGMATKADGLSVKVKVNEAKVTLIQVDNGLSISRMLLCQLCGLPLDTTVSLADEQGEQADPQPISVDPEQAFALRPELRALDLSHRIHQEKVRLARAEFLPTVALTGGYLATNPSVFNSFEKQMKGIWNVGVVVNIPIVTFGERIYKVRAAQAEAFASQLRWEETREKVELQVSQSRQKVTEASERLQTARQSRIEADENLRHANLGMQEGVIPVSQVLEAQTAWLKAHSEHTSAQIDLRLANLYLLKATGSLTITE
ncbi:MAG: TolC family protein [Parabacteroides sp.]